jgi:hypothetical protein
MSTVGKKTIVRWVTATVMVLASMPAAEAGILGALDDLANAAQDSGVNVPNSVYEAGNTVQDMRDAGQQVTPSATQIASPPACPPGYDCTPQTPPPACPPGYTCTPQASGTVSPTLPEQTAQQTPSAVFTPLPQEVGHAGNPHYIHFVMPNETSPAQTVPMGHPGHYRRFLFSDNNRELPYLRPSAWKKYIVETYRLWPREQRLSPTLVAPGFSHGALYKISDSNYRFFAHTAAAISMADMNGQMKLAQERMHGVHVPNLWVILDPDCTLSYDFYQQAKKYADNGLINIHVVLVGMDAGSPGRAEAILSSRVPGVMGGGAGSEAQTALAENFDQFSFSPEQGGIAPMHGNVAAKNLVLKNDRLAFASCATYSRKGNVTQMIAYPTMLFRYHGHTYVYTDINSSPILYTPLLQALAQA